MVSSTSTWRRAIRETGGLRAAFQPNSTTGGLGDRLHPNRAGYLAMGTSVDLALFAPLLAGAESRPPRTTRLSRSPIIE